MELYWSAIVRKKREFKEEIHSGLRTNTHFSYWLMVNYKAEALRKNSRKYLEILNGFSFNLTFSSFFLLSTKQFFFFFMWWSTSSIFLFLSSKLFPAGGQQPPSSLPCTIRFHALFHWIHKPPTCSPCGPPTSPSAEVSPNSVSAHLRLYLQRPLAWLHSVSVGRLRTTEALGLPRRCHLLMVHPW